MSFGLLTCLGLREQHRLLDIGCGSLRVGRLLIPYLGRGHYTGIEPEGELVEAGIREELGRELVTLKQPRFLIAADTAGLPPDERFDFALAQSVFSHTGEDLLVGWLREASAHLADTGALAATFVPGEAPAPAGWTGGAVMHRPSRMRELATAAGLSFEHLDWRHPAQTWALFAKPGFDRGPLAGGAAPSWNGFLDDALERGTVGGQPLHARFGDLES